MVRAILIPLMKWCNVDSNSVRDSNQCQVRSTLSDWYWLVENGLNMPHQSTEGQAKSEHLPSASHHVNSKISGLQGPGSGGWAVFSQLSCGVNNRREQGMWQRSYRLHIAQHFPVPALLTIYTPACLLVHAKHTFTRLDKSLLNH